MLAVSTVMVGDDVAMGVMLVIMVMGINSYLRFGYIAKKC